MDISQAQTGYIKHIWEVYIGNVKWIYKCGQGPRGQGPCGHREPRDAPPLPPPHSPSPGKTKRVQPRTLALHHHPTPHPQAQAETKNVQA